MMGTMNECRRVFCRSIGIGRSRGVGSRPHWAMATVLLMIAIVGCGPRGPAVEMVEGVVLLDGEPVEGATVFFSPAPKDKKPQGGVPAAGRTGAGGTFRLNAVGGAKAGAGTKVGEYVVTIVKQESDALPAPDPSGPPAPPGEIKLRDLLPAVYKLGTTSPLRATVKQGKNTYRFELDSSAKAGPAK
jgi:hypothetical protein